MQVGFCCLLWLRAGARCDGGFFGQTRAHVVHAHADVRSPRLALIPRDIKARLASPELGLAEIARLHHRTLRQVQRLFAQKGICFSDDMRDARLPRTHAKLANPGHSDRRVLEVAFDCGFSDIATFDRRFRQRYGVAPHKAGRRGFNGVRIPQRMTASVAIAARRSSSACDGS
ncbi:helix-turn-helix domain-containing protein [Ottowia sp. VDI28]|uniref:helix-turn-helix domain-containing protein n=1 Tax=Ottowia sp. VDI28 TaxID=3133968 RepID=UPI003C2B68DA